MTKKNLKRTGISLLTGVLLFSNLSLASVHAGATKEKVKKTNEISNVMAGSKITDISDQISVQLEMEKYVDSVEAISEISQGSDVEGRAELAIDGNKDTIWHSPWDGQIEFPIDYTINLKEKMAIHSLTYLPRKSGINGVITEYEILDDDENILTSGKWEANNKFKKAEFDKIETDTIILRVKNALSDQAGKKFVSAAEIGLTGYKNVVENVKDLIQKIPSSINDITLYDRENIELAREAYDALTKDQKEIVENTSDHFSSDYMGHLRRAEAKITELEAEIEDDGLEIGYTIPQYDLDAKHLSVIEKDPDNLKGRRYLGHPDMVQLEDGTLITIYLEGHGKGPLVLQISKDGGETWEENTNTPESWTGSQETPTVYVLNLEDGTERVILISGLPGWGTDNDGNTTGWNTSYSDDGGETWTEFKNWHSNLPNGDTNNAIVAMSSLVQLKDENGDEIQKWMGVYHNYGFENYKSYLTFDKDGNEQWSEPETYLSEYRSIEEEYNISEVGLFRSPDESRIVGMARSNTNRHKSTMFYSDDEGETWSEPQDMQGALQGHRHNPIYDPISGRLLVTFREINLVADPYGNIIDDEAGDWIAWVGTYEDIMEQNEGEYRIRIDEEPGWDHSYTGLVVQEDGTFIINSYGSWDKMRPDVKYIQQAKFKLGEVDNANGLVNRENLMTTIEEAQNIDRAKYTSESIAKLNKALEHAESVMTDDFSAQIQIDDSLVKLQTAIAGLESDKESAVQEATAAVEKAEETKSVEDIAAAQELVTALEDSVEKNDLQDRLDAIKVETPEETEEEAKRTAVLVSRMIYRLPNVRVLTVEDAGLVEAARTAYEDLSDQAKAHVTTLGNLELRENRLAALSTEDKEVIDEFAVRELQRRIYRLPSARVLTAEDAPQVEGIRSDYEALSTASKDIFSPQYLKNLELRELKIEELERN